MPIRVAVTGKYMVLNYQIQLKYFGKEKVLNRLKQYK